MHASKQLLLLHVGALLGCRVVHERLGSSMAEAAQEALGSESLLLLISRLQVGCSC
jgi:hypothetical protein